MEKTVVVRLDSASRTEGFADNIPHAYKEIVPSDKVNNGNYKPKHAQTFNDSGNQTSKSDWEANHIPIIELGSRLVKFVFSQILKQN